MSFPVICSNCGAPSGPSVGVCPFCKAAMSPASARPAGEKPDATLDFLRSAYESGKLADAVPILLQSLDQPERKARDAEDPKSAGFYLLAAKILIEAEGPTGKIRSALLKTQFADPANQEAKDLFEVIEAKHRLCKGAGDPGEILLQDVLERSPECVHALFLLGAHLFWIEGETTRSLRYLEKAVKLRPNLLRAWGCLGALYRKLGNDTLAGRAFRRCLELETDPAMKKFFEGQLRGQAPV